MPLIVNGVKSKTNDKGHGITHHDLFTNNDPYDFTKDMSLYFRRVLM